MAKTILVTGGARSGKSVIAENRCLQLGNPAVYIATAQAFDDEMRTRINAHQARRGAEWHTMSEPIALSDALTTSDGQGPRLVDCLTLWLTNLILADADWKVAADTLVRTLNAQTSPVVLVTNEVGMGIVPENALARKFRDAAGTLNQMIAAQADEVTLAVSGLPMKVK